MLWSCPTCVLEWDLASPSRGCPRCGSMLIPVPVSRNGAPWGSTGCRPRERRRTSLARLDELVRNATVPRLLQHAWPELMLPLGASLTIEGPPGSGKSTAASAIAVCLAHQHHLDVLYLSAEEGAEDTALTRFRRVAGMQGVPIAPCIALSDVADVHEADRDLLAFEEGLGGRRGLVVVDSHTQLRPALSWTTDLLATGHSVILVLHVTTSGQARGGLEPAFAATTCVRVDEKGHALLTKSRWGPSGVAHVFDARHPPRLTPRDDPGVIPFPRSSP